MRDLDNCSVYKGVGNTVKEAFEGLWDLIQYREDMCVRKKGDMYQIKIVVVQPTPEDMANFEREGI